VIPALWTARRPVRRLPVRGRVYLLLVVGVAVPLLVLGGVGWWWLRGLERRALADRLAGASAAAGHFEAGLAAELELVVRLAQASAPLLGEAAPPRSDTARLRALLEEAAARARRGATLAVLDAAGAVLAATDGPGREELQALGPEVAAEARRTGQPRLFVRGGGARPEVVVLAPARVRGGEVVGCALGRFEAGRPDPDPVLGPLARGGLAELVDGAGRVAASSGPGRAAIRLECAGALAGLARQRQPSALETSACAGPGGAAELVAFAPLAGLDWGVVLRQPLGEAYPSRGAVPWAALAGLLAAHLAVAGLFAWGAARSVTAPVARLTAEAERIASGELAVPIPPLGADEIGRLGAALDHMRERIREALARVEGANERLEERVARRTAELEQANRGLRERDALRAELLAKAITAQEAERTRVARELHDETTQNLAALILGLARAAEAVPPERRPALAEAKALAVRTLDEVHRLILDLRPAVLDDLGLLPAIRWCGERTLEARGTAVRYEFGELGRLPPELETALFRLCQEALGNVARHAQATQVLVEVEAEGGTIHLAVEDDGRGFDRAAAPGGGDRRHWGLVGIFERAALLGGQATVDSAPGAGTRVDVRIPLPPEVP